MLQRYPCTECYQTIILGLVGMLSVVFFFSPTDNSTWDPSYYYAQMRCPLLEHNLDFGDETDPPNPYRTDTGLPPSPWPIGPGILWSPFFLAAHGYQLTVGDSSEVSGYAPPYIAWVAGGATLYGLLGVLVIYRICRFFAGKGASLLTALLVLFATPLFFYVYRQPLMAHSSSVLAAALLVYILLAIYEERIPFHQSGLLIGTFVGLSVLLRWIGGILVLLPVVFWLARAGEALAKREYSLLRAVAVQVGIAAGAAQLVFLPQMALWYRVHQAWVIMPNQGFSENLFPVHLFDLFIHTNRGLLFWSPFILVGMAGLLLVRPLRFRLASLLFLAAYLAILGSWEIWYGGGGFGPRYFIEVLPLAAAGFARLITRFWHGFWPWRGIWRVILGAIAVLLVAHQLVLVTIIEQGQGWIPSKPYEEGAPMGLAYQQTAIKRIIQNPGDLLLPRPYVQTDRQSMIVNLLVGQRDCSAYRIPLIAAVLVGAGLFFYRHIERARLLPIVCTLIIVFMAVWFWFLLFIVE